MRQWGPLVIVWAALAACAAGCAAEAARPAPPQPPAAEAAPCTIVVPQGASYAEALAAKEEVRRYVYLRTARLLPIVEGVKTLPEGGDLIVVATEDRRLPGDIAAPRDSNARKCCPSSTSWRRFARATGAFSWSPVPATLPAGYDPARLGAELLAGESWQGLVAAGTPDNGWANLTKTGRFSIGSSATPSNPSVLGIFPDPHGTFGQVVRYRTPAGTPTTIEDRRSFKPSSRVWARSTFLFRGTDPAGFTAKTRTPGESGTLKLIFLFPEDNKTRMDWVLTSSGFLAHGSPRHGNADAVQVPMTNSGAGVPPPEPAGPFKGVYVTSKPAGAAAHDMLTSGDWYELVMNYETTGLTSYIHRWFLRRLTVNGAWAPWPTPVWVGCATTSGTPRLYHEIWRTGNKSGAADAEQFLFLGPWEVTSPQDPYGWDRYGK